MPRTETCWIPLKRPSLYWRFVIRFRQLNAVAYVIKDRFTTPGLSHSVNHSRDKCCYFGRRSFVMWLITDLERDNIRVVFVSLARVFVYVIKKLLQVIMLSFDGGWVHQTRILSILRRKPGSLFIRFRISISPEGDGCDDKLHSPLFHFCYRKIEQPEMLVVEKISKERRV